MGPVDVMNDEVVATSSGGEVRPGEVRPTVSSRRISIRPVGWPETYLVWIAAVVVDTILALDFVFHAAGARDTRFAALIYNLGDALSHPFNTIFTNTPTRSGSSAHWGDLMAIAIYSVAAWIVARLIVVAKSYGSRGAASV